MRVKDLQHLADQRSGKILKVFNPTTKDFIWKYNRVEYTIPTGEMREFDYHVAKHLAKHLVDRILTEKGVPTKPSKKRKEWIKKVLI